MVQLDLLINNIHLPFFYFSKNIQFSIKKKKQSLIKKQRSPRTNFYTGIINILHSQCENPQMEINKYTENKKEKTSSSQLEMRNHQVRKIDIDNTTTLSPIVANNTLKHELLSKLTIPIVESHVNVQFLDRKALVPTKGEVKNMQLDIKFQFSGIKFNLKHNLNKQSVQIMINEAREEALLRQKMFISELMDFCEQNSVAKIFVLLNRALPEFNKSKENLEFGGFHSINSKNMKIASQESLKDYSIMKFVFETESDEQSESHNSVNEELSSTSEEDSQQEEEFKVAQN